MMATISLVWQRWLLVLLLSSLASVAAAQVPPDPIKLGQVDRQDLTAAPFVADSGASAVVLCDFGRTRLQGKGRGFEVVFERVTRIKILTKAGYDEATIEIPLYHRDGAQEKVWSLRGWTHNLVNGAVEKTKLEANGAFIEKRTPTWNVQKFTLPNVREGSVIEFSYTLRSDFLFNFQDWTFQRTIPVRWSEYRVSIPSFYKYKIIYQGAQPFFVNKASVGATILVVENTVPTGGGLSAGQSTGSLSINATTDERQWVLKDVRPLREEPYMTAAQDYVARLDFELTGEQWPEEPYRDLTGTWEKINERLLKDEEFGGRLGHPGFLKEQLRGVAAQYPEMAARAAAVRQLVLGAVRYNGTDRYFAPDPLRKAYEARLGTSGEVNLLLLAALRETGLVAHPLLLSTRDHGRISREFPLLERFNYVAAVVVLADGKDLLLDATDPLLPCGVLPSRCLNRSGRLIAAKPEEGRWVDLTPAQRHVHYQHATLALDARGGLSGTVHEEWAGYAAADARAAITAQGDKKYLAALARPHESWAFENMALSQVADVEKPVVAEYKFTHPASEERASNTLYLSQMSEFGVRRNPFQAESRDFAVDFGMQQEATVVIALTLPAGYELAELPKPAVVELPNGVGRFVYTVASTGPGSVQLNSRLTLRNAVYPPEQYAQLRELYRLVISKQSERLVIRKKG